MAPCAGREIRENGGNALVSRSTRVGLARSPVALMLDRISPRSRKSRYRALSEAGDATGHESRVKRKAR